MRYEKRGWSGTCGVYLITNKVNGKRYVGASNNVSSRISQHFGTAMRRYKDINPFYEEIYKYGRDNFVVELLEKCDRDKKIEREQYWYTKIHPEYNLVYPDEQPFKNELVQKKSKQAQQKPEIAEKIKLAHQTEHCRQACREIRRKNMVSCYGKDENGNLTPVFESMTDAVKWLKVDAKIPCAISKIKKSITYPNLHAYGYKWKGVVSNEDHS